MTPAKLLKESPCFMTIQPSLHARWTKPPWHYRQAGKTEEADRLSRELRERYPNYVSG